MNYSTYQQKTPPHTRCQVVMFDPKTYRESMSYGNELWLLLKDNATLVNANRCDHPTALIRNEDGSHTVLARDVFELSYEPVN